MPCSVSCKSTSLEISRNSLPSTIFLQNAVTSQDRLCICPPIDFISA